MSGVTTSYRKTVVAATIAGLAVIAVTHAGRTLAAEILPASFVVVLIALGWVVGVLLLTVALGGLLASYRHSGREQGKEDLFLTLNRARSEVLSRDQTARPKAVTLPRLRRWLGAPEYIVNDTVRISSLQEIFATLDANGCLDGLPFMPEMAKHCGSVGTIFRCVDKIYDYGGRKDMRRLKDTVSIAGLRCDGSAHDGCQARCYLLWKTAWIKKTDVPATSGGEPSVEPADVVDSRTGFNPSFGPTFVKIDATRNGRYVCQFTQLVQASTSMSPTDPRQDLRPLIAGNVTVLAFGVAMLTRLFNGVQALRGGIDFPPTYRNSGIASRQLDLNLQPGELVRVRAPEKIFETLNESGRNRGLWFDRGMLNYCKRCYPVLSRVEKIIDDASGRLLRMKTPCIVLKGVDASGEYVRFLAQHDYPFWREAWLERVDRSSQPDSSAANDGVQRSNGER